MDKDFSKIPFEQILKTGSGSDFSKKLISALENQDLGMLIFFDNDPCKTSLKESLLANPEFRKVFKKNLRFLTQAGGKLDNIKARKIFNFCKKTEF